MMLSVVQWIKIYKPTSH